MHVLSTLEPIALQISNLLHWYSDPHEADDLVMMYRSQLKVTQVRVQTFSKQQKILSIEVKLSIIIDLI